MTLITLPTTPVAVTYAPAPVVEDNKATRKLAQDEAVREVNRAINTWLYTQG